MSVASFLIKLVDGIGERVYKVIDNAPTTNLRILLTLAIVLGTAIKYWLSVEWIPVWEWLIFLAGMAGIDVWQHAQKRRTTWSPKEHAEAEVIRNGHDEVDIDKILDEIEEEAATTDNPEIG